MKFLYLIFFIFFSKNIFPQTYQCPINDGIIIEKYKNDYEQQSYKGAFIKDSIALIPVDVTILTNIKEAEVKSIVKGKILYVNDNKDFVIIIYDNNKLIVYDLIKDAIVQKGGDINIGDIIGSPSLNKFKPRNYKTILETNSELYNINLTFYAFDKEKHSLTHNSVTSKVIDCKIIFCDSCQPKVYGM